MAKNGRKAQLRSQKEAERKAKLESVRLHKEAVDRRNRRTLVGLLGLVAVGGAGLAIKAGYDHYTDPMRGLDELVTPYSGTGDITLAQARAFPELRDAFVKQVNATLEEMGELEKVMYAGTEEFWLQEQVSFFEKLRQRGFQDLPSRESLFDVFKRSVNDNFENAEAGTIRAPIGVKLKGVIMINPQFFTYCHVTYEDGEKYFLKDPSFVDTTKKVRNIGWVNTVPDDLVSAIRHERRHVSVFYYGYREGKLFLDHTNDHQISRNDQNALMESDAYLYQISAIINGEDSVSAIRRRELSVALSYYLREVEKLAMQTHPSSSSPMHLKKEIYSAAQHLLQRASNIRNF